MPFFNVLSFVVSRQIATNQGIADPGRQNYYGLLGGVMGSNPVGLGVAVALSNQEAEQSSAVGAPTLASINPANAAPNSTVSVTLTGVNFVAPVTIRVPDGSGLTATVASVSPTKITASLSIAANAAPGTIAIQVATPNGTSGSVNFMIAGSTSGPALASISPASGAPNKTVSVTLNGTNFSAPATINVPQNSGITATVTNVSATAITADFVIAANAALSALPITVTTASGTSGSVNFTIAAAPAAPTLTAITPNQGSQGATVPVNLAGTNFIPGSTTVNVTTRNAGDVTVQNLLVDPNGNQLYAEFVISAAAEAVADNVTVTTPGGTSQSQAFTVTAAVIPQVARQR